jgi:hypothetical protein
MPVPDPLPETNTLIDGFFFMNTSAALWAIGKTGMTSI